MKKIFAFMLTLMLAASVLTSCKKDNGENTVFSFVKAYYTVNQNDFNYFQEMSTDPSSAKSKKDFETNSKKFKKYFTSDAYKIFYTQGASYKRISDAVKNNYLSKVSDIKITDTEKDKNGNTITYTFSYQYSMTDRSTKKVKKLKLSNGLTVKKVNDKWEITNTIVGN